MGILALLGKALQVFDDDIPALNMPAPSWVGVLFLAVPAVLVVFALVRHYRRKK